MKWTSILGLLLAFGSLGFVARTVFIPDQVDPEQVLAQLEAALERDNLEPEPLLRLTEHALRHPSMGDSPQLKARLLVAQADLYAELESWAEARQCLERVSLAMGQATPQVRLRLAHVLDMEGKAAEAWQLCVEILSTAPDNCAAWSMRGVIEAEQAETKLNEGLENLNLALAGREADKAADIAREMAMRSQDDPARLRLVNDLRSRFEAAREGVLGVESLASFAEASTFFDEARRSYARSVELLPQAPDKQSVRAGQEALGGLLGLLWGAEQNLATAELGSNALPLLQNRAGEQALLATLGAMDDLGQGDRAMVMLNSLDLQSATLPMSLVSQACRMAWEARELPMLSRLANALRLRGTSVERRQGAWYAAMSLLSRPTESQVERIDLVQRGLRIMAFYLDGKRHEPVIHGTAMLLLAGARGFQDLDQPADEMSVLAEATQLAPDLDGTAWLRLAELQRAAPGAGYRIPEESMTRGMALAPEQASALVPAWEQLGLASLQAENRSLKTMRRALTETGSGLREYGPAARHLLAKSFFQDGDYPTCQSLARRLRLDYPGLLPALDLELEGFLARGASTQAGILLMERLEITGADAPFRSYLTRVGVDRLTPAQTRRLTLLDPRGAGRLAIAGQFLQLDRPADALIALGTEPDPLWDTPRHHLSRAETLIRLGLPREAAAPAKVACDNPATRGQGWLLLIQARLAGQPETLTKTVDQFLKLGVNPDAQLPYQEILDALLGASRTGEARRIAGALDGHKEFRGAALLQRLVLCDALLGSEKRLADSLDRWEAFRGDGAVEWTRLVLAFDRSEWSRLPSLAQEVRSTKGFKPSHWQETLLAVCEEQPEEALRLAQEGQAAHPLDPSWSLTLGLLQDLENLPIDLPELLGESATHELFRVLHPTGGAPLDPRRMLGLLAADQLEGWGLWTLPRIANLSPEPTLWALMLAERAQQSLGQTERAERVREAVTSGHPSFSPAWMRRESFAIKNAQGDPWSSEVLALRLARCKAAGPQGEPGDAHDTLDRALMAWDVGKATQAQRLLDKYLKENPDEHQIRWVLARIKTAEGEFVPAIGEMYRVWRELNPVLPTPEAGPQGERRRARFNPAGTPRTRELLELIASATDGANAPLRLEDAASLLRSMEEAIPHDPLILLARTKAETERDESSAALAAARAEGALTLLHQRLTLIGLNPRGELAIEDVCPGAAATWGEWLLEISPSLANEFLESELLKAPGRTDLWRLNAEALIALGQLTEAENHLEALSLASHGPQSQLLLGALRARTGFAVAHVTRTLDPVRPRLDKSQTALADFSATWATLQHGGPPGPNLIVLGRLWRERFTSLEDLDPNLLGLVYLSTLAHRNREQDLTVLRTVSKVLLRGEGGRSYIGPVTRAMAGVSETLLARQGAN